MPPRGSSPPGEADTLTSTGSVCPSPVEGLLVPGLTVLAHPESRRIGERVALAGLGSNLRVRLARLEPTFAQPGSGRVAPLADAFLSRRPITLGPGERPGSIRIDPGDCPTALELAGHPLTAPTEVAAEEVASGVVLLLARRVALLLSLVDPSIPELGDDLGLLGSSPAMLALRREIRRAADLPVPLLLLGATGTGKELAARALHQASKRRRGPFVAVNMAAFPPALAAAELFGAIRGAYTGADRERLGFFRRAQGGTLFLDEIGETPSEVQPLLLRALESGEVQPLGGGQPVALEVRLVAATDADLRAAVAAGRFRAPLLHRLSGYEVEVPSLAERREDIGRLLRAFLGEELVALGRADRLEPPEPGGRPWLDAGLVARLVAYDWPGNVRQLRNVARRLAAHDGDPKAVEDLPGIDDEPRARGEPTLVEPAGRGYRDPATVSLDELRSALEAHQWRLQPTARALGISRTSLYAKMAAESGLRKASDLTPPEIEDALARSGGDLRAAAACLSVSQRGLVLRMRRLEVRPRS